MISGPVVQTTNLQPVIQLLALIGLIKTKIISDVASNGGKHLTSDSSDLEDRHCDINILFLKHHTLIGVNKTLNTTTK